MSDDKRREIEEQLKAALSGAIKKKKKEKVDGKSAKQKMIDAIAEQIESISTGKRIPSGEYDLVPRKDQKGNAVTENGKILKDRIPKFKRQWWDKERKELSIYFSIELYGFFDLSAEKKPEDEVLKRLKTFSLAIENDIPISTAGKPDWLKYYVTAEEKRIKKKAEKAKSKVR